MGAGEVPPQNAFIPASATADRYKNLNRRGSCLRLFDLLVENPLLLHQMEPEGVTILHKGVRYGCVRLVRHILEEMFDAEGNCACGLHDADYSCQTRDDLLRKTCSDGVTAVHIAVVSGSPKMVLLLKWAIDRSSYEKTRRMVEKVPAQESSEGLFDEKLTLSYDEISSRFMREKRMSDEEINSLFMREKGHLVEATLQNTNVQENDHSAPVLPKVTDEGIDGVYDRYSNENVILPKAYAIIEGVLENSSVNKEEIDMLKDACTRDVDFEFSPVAQVFLHFLWSGMGAIMCRCLTPDAVDKIGVSEEIMRQIIEANNRCDYEEGTGRSLMLKALFNLHDPQGRTFLHVAYQNIEEDYVCIGTLRSLVRTMEWDDLSPSISFTTIAEYLNAQDAAGRTLLHFMCIHNTHVGEETCKVLMEKFYLNARVLPLRGQILKTLLKWCLLDQFGEWCNPDEFKCIP